MLHFIPSTAFTITPPKPLAHHPQTHQPTPKTTLQNSFCPVISTSIKPNRTKAIFLSQKTPKAVQNYPNTSWKQEHHFSNNPHANFTMRNQRLDKLQDLSQCDDVADENVDKRSLSRVSDRIVNRGSITNKLHNSFDNIFNVPRNSLKQKQSHFKLTSANLIQVNLDSAEKGPVGSRLQGIVSKNYFPPMQVNNTMSRMGGSFSQRLSQSNGSYEVDTELKQKKLLYLSQKLMKLKKKNLIKDLKLLSQKISQNMKEKKQQREKKILRSKLSKKL